MAEVRLDFVKPEIPDLAHLHIYESASVTGPFNPIEQVDAIGTYPNYITYYTTQNAGAVNHFFTIEWEDSKGALFGMSAPVQGNVRTLIGEIVQRVLLRDSTLNEQIVTQEALAVIEQYFNADPLSINLASVSYQVQSGLTLMTMVRAYIFASSISSDTSDYVAGLVSQKQSSTSKVDLDKLLSQANMFLGTNFSVVMVMEDLEIAGGLAQQVTVDQTRLIVEIP